MARLKIVRTDGSVLEGEITPAVEYSFEMYAKKGFQICQCRGFRPFSLKRDLPFTYLIARLSIRLGIAPQHLLELDKVMLDALLQGLSDEAKEIKDASNSKRRR
jgi:hypothetical protein